MDSCVSDSGGPVLKENTQGKVECQYGVIVRGPKECDGSGSVNLRISHYLEWIEKAKAELLKVKSDPFTDLDD